MFIIIGIFILGILGISFVVRFLRKVSKLDLIHYPNEGIDMCRFCQFEYPSYKIDSELKRIKEAARMGINMPEDYWDRFCCDALRNKFKAHSDKMSTDYGFQLIERSFGPPKPPA